VKFRTVQLIHHQHATHTSFVYYAPPMTVPHTLLSLQTPTMPTPISKNGFFYGSEGLYVEINNHQHTRSDSGSLYHHLRSTTPPARTKTRRIAGQQPAAHKDYPGHFYIAQLKHYGLPEVKTKHVAKERLLAAFDPTTQTLRVPDHILEIERELRDEYERAVIKEEKQKQKRDEKKMGKQQAKDDAMLREFADIGVIISKDCIDEVDGELGDSEEDSGAQLCREIEGLSDVQLRAVVKKLALTGSSTTKQETKHELASISKVPTPVSRRGTKVNTYIILIIPTAVGLLLAEEIAEAYRRRPWGIQDTCSLPAGSVGG
jgi:hypothetical protein